MNSTIIPPHAPNDAAKVEALRAAYEAGEAVPAIVGLALTGEIFCLNGSHRIAAGGEPSIVVDGNEIYAAANADQQAALDRLFDGRPGDLDSLFRLILPLLPEDAAAVLSTEYGL